MRVAEDLHLDVARGLDPALDQQRSSPKAALASRRADAERRRERAGLAHDAHALAAATGRGLHQQRIAERGAALRDLGVREARRREAAEHRHAGGLHQRLGFDLVPIAPIASTGGPMNMSPAVAHAAREVGVLREKAVAGMHRVGARRARRLEERSTSRYDSLAAGAAERHRFVGVPHVRRVRVGIGIHRDARDPHLAQRAQHAARDLAAVRDQHLARAGVRFTSDAGTRRSSVASSNARPSRARSSSAIAEHAAGVARVDDAVVPHAAAGEEREDSFSTRPCTAPRSLASASSSNGPPARSARRRGARSRARRRAARGPSPRSGGSARRRAGADRRRGRPCRSFRRRRTRRS